MQMRQTEISLNSAINNRLFSLVIYECVKALRAPVEKALTTFDEVGLDFTKLPTSSTNNELVIAEALLHKIYPPAKKMKFATNNGFQKSCSAIFVEINKDKLKVSEGYSSDDVLHLLTIMAFLPGESQTLSSRVKAYYERFYHYSSFPPFFPPYLSVLVKDGYKVVVEEMKRVSNRFNYEYSDNPRLKDFFTLYQNIYLQLLRENGDFTWILLEIFELYQKLIPKNPELATFILNEYFTLQNKENKHELYNTNFMLLARAEMYLTTKPHDFQVGNRIVQEICREYLLTYPNLSSQFLHVYTPISTNADLRNEGLKKLEDKTELIELFNKYYYNELFIKDEERLEHLLLQITNIIGPLYSSKYVLEFPKVKEETVELEIKEQASKPEILPSSFITKNQFKSYFINTFVNKKLEKTDTYWQGFTKSLYDTSPLRTSVYEKDFYAILNNMIDDIIQENFITAQYTLVNWLKDKNSPEALDKSYIFFPLFKAMERLIIKIVSDFFGGQTITISFAKTDTETGERKHRIYIHKKHFKKPYHYKWTTNLTLAERIEVLVSFVGKTFNESVRNNLNEKLQEWRQKVRNQLTHDRVVKSDMLLFNYYYDCLLVINELLIIYRELAELNKTSTTK